MRQTFRRMALTMPIVVGALLQTSCMTTTPTSDDGLRAAYATLASSSAAPAQRDAALKTVLDAAPRVVLREAGVERTYVVLEGDLLVLPDQVGPMLAPAPGKAGAPSGQELNVMVYNGQDDIWPRGQRQLTYAVDRSSFASQSQYDTASKAFAAAAKSWVDACATCDLSFTHRQELDQVADAGQQVTFVVRYRPEATQFIAKAFFPHYAPFRREVTIAPSWYTTSVDRTGILRHEIGHVIGYRHGHIGGIPGCAYEDQNWRPLTAYDPKSVMHYLCGGAGSAMLELTATDIAGHRLAYGQ